VASETDTLQMYTGKGWVRGLAFNNQQLQCTWCAQHQVSATMHQTKLVVAGAPVGVSQEYASRPS
jgi:hypothetical protein